MDPKKSSTASPPKKECVKASPPKAPNVPIPIAMKAETVTTSESQRGKQVHHYEKVKPRDVDQPDPWSEDSGVGFGRRWWWQKDKKKKRNVIVKLLILFGVILTVVIVLIALGAYFMVKKQKELDSQLDRQLRSKVAICREQYSDVDPECLTEDANLHSQCDHEKHKFCLRDYWGFTNIHLQRLQDMATASHFHKHSTAHFIGDTDYADCGNGTDQRHWCENKKCVDSGIKAENWYRSMPFPEKEGKWIERDVDDMPCLKASSDSETLFNSLKSWYVGSCGKSVCPQHCNDSSCSVSKMVKVALRVGLYHCDLNFDQATGARGRICEHGSPIKLMQCGQCEKFDETQIASEQQKFASEKCSNAPFAFVNSTCVFSCAGSSHDFPDGTPCIHSSLGSWKAAACLMGACYPLEDDEGAKYHQ